jgi:hypothetical protein
MLRAIRMASNVRRRHPIGIDRYRRLDPDQEIDRFARLIGLSQFAAPACHRDGAQFLRLFGGVNILKKNA